MCTRILGISTINTIYGQFCLYFQFLVVIVIEVKLGAIFTDAIKFAVHINPPNELNNQSLILKHDFCWILFQNYLTMASRVNVDKFQMMLQNSRIWHTQEFWTYLQYYRNYGQFGLKISIYLLSWHWGILSVVNFYCNSSGAELDIDWIGFEG